MDVPDVLGQFHSAAECAGDLRALMLSELPEASWTSRSELAALIGQIEQREQARTLEQRRTRLLALAHELERGSIVHRRVLRVSEVDQLRQAAINELCSEAATANPKVLAGPPAEQWVGWACGLKEPQDAESLRDLHNGFPLLDDFVANIEPDMWILKAESAAQEESVEVHHSEETSDLQQRCSRLFALASELERGSIVHHRAPRANQLNQLRDEGIKELRQLALEAMPPILPGPGADEWIGWACGLKEPEDAESLQSLHNSFPQLDDFITNIELTMWVAGGTSGEGPDPARPSVKQEHFPLPPNGVEGARPQPESRPPQSESIPLKADAAARESRQISHSFEQTSPSAQDADTLPQPSGTPDKAPQNVGPSGRLWEDKWRKLMAIVSVLLLVLTGVATVKWRSLRSSISSGEVVHAKTPELKPGDQSYGQPTVSGARLQVAQTVTASSATPGQQAPPASGPEALTAQKLSTPPSAIQGLLVEQVSPIYPEQARAAHIQGTVVLQAVIGKDGSVQNVHVVSGHPMLVPAAMDAVKRWRYKPFYLNGQPSEAEVQINVNFTPSG